MINLSMIDRLPKPNLDLQGWPWTEEFRLDPLPLSADQYPRISIVTPSYNQGEYIEETIRSVLLQGYPNLQYIIMDGGSTDNTVEVIKKYEPWITCWVSEKDRGQTHAINKGMAKATGDILAYINSDDYYLPGAFFKVAEHFLQNPSTDLLHGRCRYVDEKGKTIGGQWGDIRTFQEVIDLWGVWWQKRQFVQPEVFWTRRIAEKVGPFNEKLFFVMDYDYWCRIFKAGGRVGKLGEELTCFRFTPNQKSNQGARAAQELLDVARPWIWDRSNGLSWRKRLDLQGRWAYHQHIYFRPMNPKESKFRRWMDYAGVVWRYPQILWTQALYQRLREVRIEK